MTKKTVIDLLKASDVEIKSDIKALMAKHDDKLKELKKEDERIKAERVENIKLLTKNEKVLAGVEEDLAKAEKLNHDANVKLSVIEKEKKDFAAHVLEKEKEIAAKQKKTEAALIASKEKFEKIDVEHNRAKSLKEEYVKKLETLKAFLASV